jgi:hypothetical protein
MTMVSAMVLMKMTAFIMKMIKCCDCEEIYWSICISRKNSLCVFLPERTLHLVQLLNGDK